MKAWYSFFDFSGYKGDEPAFFPTESLTWVHELEKNSGIISTELQNIIEEKNEFQPYFSKKMNEKKTWRTFVLKWWGIDFHKNQNKCPNTSRILRSIPGLVSASFSSMDAQSEIPAHFGDTNAIYRAHLGLVIPESLPQCGFKVMDEVRGWEQGKVLVFCDAHNHSAFNHSHKVRIVMIIDVFREEFIKEKEVISANVMASLFLQKRIAYFPFYKLAPKFFGGLLHFIAKVNALWFIPFRNDLFKMIFSIRKKTKPVF